MHLLISPWSGMYRNRYPKYSQNMLQSSFQLEVGFCHLLVFRKHATCTSMCRQITNNRASIKALLFNKMPSKSTNDGVRDNNAYLLLLLLLLLLFSNWCHQRSLCLCLHKLFCLSLRANFPYHYESQNLIAIVQLAFLICRNDLKQFIHVSWQRRLLTQSLNTSVSYWQASITNVLF